VQRTVRGFERAGAAMVQLEDQGFPKRCGHLDGKTVVSTSEMCGKLHAALDARHSEQTLILARTDALAIEGLDAALDRALNGVEVPVFFKGEQVGSYQRYDERLTLALLRTSTMRGNSTTPRQHAARPGWPITTSAPCCRLPASAPSTRCCWPCCTANTSRCACWAWCARCW
jgi:hypothetical protein